MRKILILVAAALLLCACTHKNDFQYLTTHPKYLEQLLANCNREVATTSQQEQVCATAEQARQEVHRLLQIVMASPQNFGKEIIREQQKLASLKQQYGKKPTADLNTMIDAQKALIDRHLAICKYVGE